MGIQENKIERYLHDQVTALGGTTRKWTGPRGVPDRVVILPWGIWLVEVKLTHGKMTPQQIREHQRLNIAGAQVRTVYGYSGVDDLIEEIKQSCS